MPGSTHTCHITSKTEQQQQLLQVTGKYAGQQQVLICEGTTMCVVWFNSYCSAMYSLNVYIAATTYFFLTCLLALSQLCCCSNSVWTLQEPHTLLGSVTCFKSLLCRYVLMDNPQCACKNNQRQRHPRAAFAASAEKRCSCPCMTAP